MKKKIAVFACFVIIVIAFLGSLNIESVSEHEKKETAYSEAQTGTVSISITCDTILKNMDKLDTALKEGDYVPDDGVILKECEYSIQNGDTVFDVLQRAVSDNSIQMEYQGSTENVYGSVYIKGIAYLYEFSCGQLSGWMYKVNGEVPDVGCNLYTVSPGDRIEWLYTCELGKDI